MKLRRTTKGALRIALCLMVALLVSRAPASIAAQSATATLTGTAIDESAAVVPEVEVTVINETTRFLRRVTSDDKGVFSIPLLPPGTYTVRAERQGFTTTELRDVVLNVGDQVALRIRLKVESIGEQVTVLAESGRVRTSPAVGTVVDRQFVSTLPMNGRSLQALLELTPGVTLFKANSNPMGGGQFSVNGQRTHANYFTVDGVSANTGVTMGFGSFAGQSASGSLPGLTTLGTTTSLVSIDALQEFRIQTSTYAPEFGRTPGGQVSMVTRSGTNEFHGTVFEYFRDDAMDANDWFANSRNLPKPKMRQHDVGGTFGGPLAAGRTFFFASYEALRLDQPQTKIISVPSMALRQAAPPAMQALLNTYSVPNGPELSGGLAEFAASYSDPGESDSLSIRLDQSFGSSVNVFGRYQYAPSLTRQRSTSLSTITQNKARNNSLTGGATWLLSPTLTNELRVNFTHARGSQTREMDTFGGAVLLPDEVMFPAPLNAQNAYFGVSMTGTGSNIVGTGEDNLQRQVNLVDNVSWARGGHQIKFGVDYRAVIPTLNRAGINRTSLSIGTEANARAGLLQNAQIARGADESLAIYNNLSLYAQDTWTATNALTLTYGLRWELNPPPGTLNDHLAVTLDGLDGDGPIRLAPRNTPLWKTTYTNFEPRVGAAYQLSTRNGWETVVRGGAGLFHDMGMGASSVGFEIYPYAAYNLVSNTPYPLSAAAATPPVPGVGAPQQLYIMDRNLKQPYTYQWNVSFEQALGPSQTATISYVGSAGRRLLWLESHSLQIQDFGAVQIPVAVTRNAAESDYRALQFQYQRRLSKGLQVLANYTWAQSTDTSSDDLSFGGSSIPITFINLEAERGPSNFDVRHVFSAAMTYNLPAAPGSRVVRALTRDWGVDTIARARGGFPLNVLVQTPYPPTSYSVRPDVIPGVPMVVTGADIPGGWRINRDAFAIPAAYTVGNYPRNSLRGFGAWQVDLTLRRELRLGERYRVQVRGELFNVFNHPNFADPAVDAFTTPFGVSNMMLGRGLGSLNPLYQMGGPRSGQLAVKFLF